jgi:hypothetical protein
MQEIPRAILLPPPAPPPQRQAQSVGGRAVASDSDSAVTASRNTRGQSQSPAQGTAQTFLTLVETPREDTVEIKGKQFRFRPYGSRGGASDDIVREPDLADEAGSAGAIGEAGGDGEIPVDILDGFGSGAQGRNSSAFIASFIAQERLSQGLHNPQYEAASDAYRRAGGSPSAVDNQPRVFSVAV